MTENVKKFMELVSAEGEDAIQGMNKAGKEELIAMAAERGIVLTDEDFRQQEGKLSEDELDAVAGGSICVCPVGGGGNVSDNNDNACVCVLVGSGSGYSPDTYYGKAGRRVGEIKKGDEVRRCFCAVGGGGESLD